MFEHIVVGCNGGFEGRDAVALGAAIASASGGRLSLVGVFPPSPFPVAGVSDRKTLRAQANRSLREARNLFAPDALIHAVADTSVPRALTHFAQRWHADLVIVGSDRDTAAGHVRIGRRTRQLLYDAPFALAIAARDLHRQRAELHTIGVGYDGGPEAEAALAVAGQLASTADARLLVRRVVEDQVPALTGWDWMLSESRSHADLWEPVRQAAHAETEAAAARLDVSLAVSTTVGDPGYELRALSETVDLVVIGSRRWGPIARLVSGGVGETLAADATCSIMLVPRPSRRRGRATSGQSAQQPAVA